MQIKRFEAQNMAAALRLVKQEFGTDAVILSARSFKPGKNILGIRKNNRVEVTAAIDNVNPPVNKENNKENHASHSWMADDEQPDRKYKTHERIKKIKNPFKGLMTSTIRQNDMQQKKDIISNFNVELNHLYRALLLQDVDKNIASELIQKLDRLIISKNNLQIGEFKPYLTELIHEMGATFNRIKTKSGNQNIIAFIGPTGVGKTTTIARIAVTSRMSNKKKNIGFLTLDNDRIAANEQLKTYAGIIGIPVETASNRKELKNSLSKLRDKDLILVDTAGISQKNKKGIHELKLLLSKIHPAETHLVMSANTKNDVLEDIIKKFRIITYNRFIFTKLDESITYGDILNQLIWTKTPASYFTNSQQVPEGIEIAKAERLVAMLIKQVNDSRVFKNTSRMMKYENVIKYDNDYYSEPHFSQPGKVMLK